MSSYRTIDQGLPAYHGQPSSGYQQPAGSYGQQSNYRENALPRVRDDKGDEGILGPGEIPAEALNVCMQTINRVNNEKIESLKSFLALQTL